jgi:hypothetical protein
LRGFLNFFLSFDRKPHCIVHLSNQKSKARPCLLLLLLYFAVRAFATSVTILLLFIITVLQMVPFVENEDTPFARSIAARRGGKLLNLDKV